MTASQPVIAAYVDARMHVPCPTCGARANDWCRRTDGQYRRVPCIGRLKYAVPEVSR